MARKHLVVAMFTGVLGIGMVSDAAPPEFFNTSSMPALMLNGSTQLSIAQNSAKPKDAGRRVKTGSPTIAVNKSANRIAKATASKISLVSQQQAPVITQAQQDNLKLLAASLGRSSSEVRFDWKNGTPSFIKIVGKPIKPARALNNPRLGARDIAAAFISENSSLLKLNNAAQELRLFSETAEPTGKKHLRYQQQFQGLDVWGQQLSLHLEKDGIYLVNGRYAPTPAISNTTPSVTPEAASLVAKKEFGSLAAETSTPQLIIYADHKPALLAYKLELTEGINQRWIYIIDAQTSKILNKISGIHTVGALVSASGQDLQGQNQTFNAWLENNTYYLLDPSIPSADLGDPINAGPNGKGDTFIFNAKNTQQGPFSFFTNTSSSGSWDTTAVSAMQNTLTVYRYFLNTFQRKSLDDLDKNLLVIVHAGTNENNAYWNGTQMIYGDGDGQTFSSLAKCLDVAAHEMTHGVTQHEANLIYQNQSGALNESFSDVFAAMVDRGDWTVGEDCTLVAPGFVRSLKDPSQGLPPQPAHMTQYKNLLPIPSQDNGGVHINSGIPNRAAYLLAEGLSAEAIGTSIGRDKTEKIYYRALTTYLTASAQFIDARRALIQSAEELHGAGSAEATAVAAAWDAVGVTEGGFATPDDRAPGATDPVSGADLMVYLSPQDGTRDGNPADIYNVYVQTMDSPFNAYNPAKDLGPWNNTVSAALTPPAAITDSTGTSLFYVGVDANIHFVNPAGLNEQVTTSGDIWSIAVAPNGQYFAYTTADANDRNIHIINVATGLVTDFPLRSPNYQKENAPINTVLYADSLSFDYTGTQIVYDALNCLPLPGSSCDQPNGGFRYWSIGIVDIVNGALIHPLPNQNPDFDLSFPRFATNNKFVIAFDVQDYTNAATTGIRSSVVTANFEKQTILDVIDFGLASSPLWGVPSFWGNDDFITVQSLVPTPANIAAKRIPLRSDWSGDATQAVEINPSAVAYPQMHRAGIRQLSGGLSFSAGLLDFANVAIGSNKDLSVVIQNTGNRDVTISNIAIDVTTFKHNATNTVLPRGASLPITVSFTPVAAGTQVANLTISSDGEPQALTISLTGVAAATPTPINPPAPAPSGGGGGGGGAVDILLTLILLGGAARVFRLRGRQSRLLRISNEGLRVKIFLNGRYLLVF